ncbi:MAG: AbrB/MazE/SpoVT family DNA-binding domain-containing protein [Patescibacteria group bacterium]|nr:AbrB/MazE/SpoVT family DNA-binding domain-containing protein [Patescibacteria group bacterium]
MRRKIQNKNTRKLYKKSGSYAVTIPMEMIQKLKLREGQKVDFSLKGKKIIIEDWKK